MGAISAPEVERYAFERDTMAAINQPVGQALTVRDAAAACRLSPRTIRRRLTAGDFPNAYKTGPDEAEREGIWMIPPADLEQAGLQPTLVHPALTKAARAQSARAPQTPKAPKARPAPKPKPKPAPVAQAEEEDEEDEYEYEADEADEQIEEPAPPTQLSPHSPTAPAEADGPTVLELVRSDRFGRLRAELAEAVAAAEIALLRAEAERWRVLADERAQALERADTALKALTTAMGTGMMQLQAPAPAPAPAPVPQAPAESHAQAQRGDIVAVPPLVRAEAMRYTSTMRALHETRTPSKWWQFWRV